MEYNIDMKKEFLATTSTSFRRLLELGTDSMALYMFYLYTSNQQDNQRAFASVRYIAQGLGWTKERVTKNNKILKEAGWIEEIVNRSDEGKITGWFVQVNYRVTTGTIKVPENLCLEIQNLDKQDTGYLGQNAPVINKIQQKEENAPTLTEFSNFWDIYPSKKRFKKPQCLSKWNKLTEPNRQAICLDVTKRKLTTDWVKSAGQYIPHAMTYLNGEYWLADLSEPAPNFISQNEKVIFGNPDLDSW